MPKEREAECFAAGAKAHFGQYLSVVEHHLAAQFNATVADGLVGALIMYLERIRLRGIGWKSAIS